MTKKNLLKDIFLFVLLYLACIVGAVVVYTYFNFGIVSIDKFLSVFNEVFQIDWAVKKIKIYSFILLLASFFGVYFLKAKHVIILSTLLFLLPIFEFDMVSYFLYKNTLTTFYEDNYVKPVIEKEIKNNLVVIYLESFEKQYATEDAAPFLAKLSKENISFDGFKQLSETFSTIHAQFASLCGLSLSQNNTLSGDGYINFLPNVDCIPDLLKGIGYSNAYFKAADLKFSRANYFTDQHNFDVAKGLFELEDKAAKLTKDYSGNQFGGLKDRVLFELAKDEISSLKEPFFVALTTLDMHGAPEVYHDPECPNKFGDIRDAVYCTQKSLETFVNWLKAQPFWDRTTLVIMGDHQMASRMLSSSQVFNVFVNSVASTPLKDRKFTTYDFAPTILEAMGYDIAEFGIGRSLFKSAETLFEKEGNKFHMLVSSKNELYEKLKRFDNAKASYKKYVTGKKLNNKELFQYTDFGDKNDWCNRTTYISMELDKRPNNNLQLSMRYLKANEPFKIFINNTKIYENTTKNFTPMHEDDIVLDIPLTAIPQDNKISIKFDWPYNNVNRVFGLCIREFVLNEKK